MTLKENLILSCSTFLGSVFLRIMLLFGLLGGCAIDGKNRIGADSDCLGNVKSEMKELPAEAFENADNIRTVHCLLPGIPIRLGDIVYMSPSRPAIVSAWECNVQGGKYALTSHKNGREKAIEVWEQCAKRGDKIAQNYMGEIYGKSWGKVKPDYAEAIQWFRKSAEQGYNRALNNLGFLYEQGFGVAKNKQQALKFYRQAMGVVAPIKLDQSTKNELSTLESKLGEAIQTTKTLKDQLRASEQLANNQNKKISSLKQIQGGASEIEAQLKRVKGDLDDTLRREQSLKKRLSELRPELDILRVRLDRKQHKIALKDLPNMGKYYALVIGINDYESPLASLKTPVNDAKRVEKVLREKYGFETTLLIEGDANKEAIYNVLIKLSKKLKEQDNFLIYFAGHGDLSSGSAYWLANNADSENQYNWISTDDITRKINFTDESIKARHVLIIADSCYSGGLAVGWLGNSPKQVLAAIPSGIVTRSGHSSSSRAEMLPASLIPQPEDVSAEARVGWIKAKFGLPSRKILTSGGLEPVLDEEIKNGLSVFANAFTEVLEANDGIIGAEEIYKKIGPQVVLQVSKKRGNQTPVYAPLRKAGDNFGEFYFIAR